MQIMGIDILPAELPVESSEFFSKALYPYVKKMVQTSPKTSLNELPPLLRNATIADQGQLMDPYKGLLKSSAAATRTTSTATYNDKKTVLLLGSGMVAAPLVEHLVKRPDVNIVVGMSLVALEANNLVYTHKNLFAASNMTEEADALVRHYQNAESAPLDISNHQELSRLVSKADVVVR